MPGFEGRLYESLRQAGLPDVPESFSIAVVHQEISRAIVTEIERFIRVFDRITTRPVWQEAVTATAPPIARGKRSEVCFFSAWDFHLPPERPERWQLIECNDNGSGLLFAALLNRLYYEVSGIGERRAMEAPMPFSAFSQRVTDLIRTEAEAFFGAPRAGLVLILDDEDSVRRGRFRHELVLLRDVCRRAGCHSEVASPVDTTWDGSSLLCGGERVSFVVNRSTDFFWEAPVFAPLRAAYAAGGVYVAPNPFSYATRSDKGLLERLGSPVGDADLGIRPDERLLLSDHVPETRRLRPDNVEELARDKEQWFFKPCHGFASRGVLTGAQVGRARLRRLLKKGDSYVAQRRVAKSRLDSNEIVPLWADLRVWAYRGERLLLSGRASRHADTMDLSPPGGWLPTYAQT